MRAALERGSIHARTLRGAIDAYAGSLAHTQPHIALARTRALEAMTEAWIASGGDNWLPAVPAPWMATYLGRLPPDERAAGSVAVAEFRRWARAEGLIGSGAYP